MLTEQVNETLTLRQPMLTILRRIEVTLMAKKSKKNGKKRK